MATNYRVEHRTDGVKNLDCDYEHKQFDAGLILIRRQNDSILLGCPQTVLSIGDGYLEYSSVLGTYRSKIPTLSMHINDQSVRLAIHRRFNVTSERMETYLPHDLDAIRIKKPNFRCQFPVQVSRTTARHSTTTGIRSGIKLRTKTSQLVDCEAVSSKRQKYCVRVEPVPEVCKYCNSVNLTFRKNSALSRTFYF